MEIANKNSCVSRNGSDCEDCFTVSGGEAKVDRRYCDSAGR